MPQPVVNHVAAPPGMAVRLAEEVWVEFRS